VNGYHEGVTATAAPRPALRGYLHLVAALVSPALLVALILLADSPSEYVAASVFGAGLVLLFTASALYHVPPWPPAVRRILRRIDHAAIFAFVAFAYVPFCIAVLPLAWGIPLLATVGGLALVGVVLKLSRPNLPRYLNLALYVALGWAALAALPAILVSLSPLAIVLILGSGVLYTSGAAAHAFRRPNPFPRVFGHHELFHAATIAATALLYAVVAFEALA
jgi:hemolysin III